MSQRTIIACVSGGVVQSVDADGECRVIVVDFDTDGDGETKLAGGDVNLADFQFGESTLSDADQEIIDAADAISHSA